MEADPADAFGAGLNLGQSRGVQIRGRVNSSMDGLMSVQEFRPMLA